MAVCPERTSAPRDARDTATGATGAGGAGGAGGDDLRAAEQAKRDAQLPDYRGRHPYLREYMAAHGSPDTLFVIERTKNLNLVVYEAVRDARDAAVVTSASPAHGARLDQASPVDAYWFDLDPEYVRAAREAGKTDDRVPLGAMERYMAYGYKSTPLTEDATGFVVRLTAFPNRRLVVAVEEGRPRARCLINDVTCYLEWIYVQSRERMLGAPEVISVTLYGKTIEGHEHVEHIVPEQM